MAAAQIAIPLAHRRAGLSSIVVVGLAACAFGAAAAAWGWARARLAGGSVAAAALLAEMTGTRTGWPFGRYHYTGMLHPTVAGVPAIVPLAWFGMGAAAWEVAGRITGAIPARVGLGAVALTGWDLFLDPQMTHERYWVWDQGGWYRHIPITNFVGWLLCGALVMAVLSVALPGRSKSVPLLALYSWMTVMEGIGFFVFFRDPLVGVAGAAAMIPLTAAAWRHR